MPLTTLLRTNMLGALHGVSASSLKQRPELVASPCHDQSYGREPLCTSLVISVSHSLSDHGHSGIPAVPEPDPPHPAITPSVARGAIATRISQVVDVFMLAKFSPAIRKELDLDRFPAISHLALILMSCRRVSLLLVLSHPHLSNPSRGDRPRTLFRGYLLTRQSRRALRPRIYNIAAARNCEGSYPRDAECAHIDESVTLFTLANVHCVLVHCDGTGKKRRLRDCPTGHIRPHVGGRTRHSERRTRLCDAPEPNSSRRLSTPSQDHRPPPSRDIRRSRVPSDLHVNPRRWLPNGYPQPDRLLPRRIQRQRPRHLRYEHIRTWSVIHFPRWTRVEPGLAHGYDWPAVRERLVFVFLHLP